MPDISLFQPTVLLGVVEKFTAPETLTMLNRISRKPHPFPSAQWDVIKGSRTIARPNVPNSEAHIVPRLGRESMAASFIYLREKKVFEPTTLYWVRTPGEVAKVNAEKAVLREITDLNTRFDNFVEYCIWQMFTGTLSIAADGDAPAVNVDYKMPSSHKVTASTGWDVVTSPKAIIDDVRTWKRLVKRDGQVNATEAYASEKTMSYIFDAFANAGSTPAYLLSDRMKDQYYREGTLPGFLGLDWTIQDSVFDSTNSAYGDNPTDPGADQSFLADDRVLIGNFTEGRPFELIEGPTADLEAPQGHTGKFVKTWQDKDPSGRQYLEEYNFLPVLNRPESFVRADVA